MSLKYPSGAQTHSQLSPFQQTLKLARHTSSPASTTCPGFKPPKSASVVEDPIPQQDQDDQHLKSTWLAISCALCSLDVIKHANVQNIQEQERIRKVKVAVRIDELLEDAGKLLNFDYKDTDIISLRKQMQLADIIPPPDVTPSPAAPPMASMPLISALHRKRKARSPTGSRSPSREREASVATSSRLSSPEAASRHASVAPEAKRRKAPQEHAKAAEEEVQQVKLEPVEQGIQPKSAASAVEEGVAPKKERPAVIEEKTGLIQFRVVTNDNNPESMILLMGLKNIFQRQLPKMPREYITRLVFDRNHQSLAIVKRGLQVVGGITYRPFKQRTFAEIVFCAITSTEQVKGYGSHLMNHLKDHVKATSPVMHFLTYADNYAIGYFKKQGFTKEISLDRAIWVGYIKDYEGGTLMQCSMVPRVKYLEVQDMLASQKEAILAKIRTISRSHIIHRGIDAFKDRDRLIAQKGLIENPDGTIAVLTKEEGEKEPHDPTATFLVDPSDIPGLKESGWTPEMDELSRRPKRGPHFAVMRHILVELNGHGSAWPFVNPVNGEEVTDYYDVIKNPMDLSTMEAKLENNQYANVDELVKDAQLIFDNCRTYNPASSPYAKSATKLEKYLHDTLLPKVQSSLL